MGVKSCTMCGESKSLAEFNRKGSGYQPRCRECNKLYLRRHYQDHKEYYKAKAKYHTVRLLDRLREKYKGQPCVDCGSVFPTCVMEFDHRPGEIKLADVSALILAGNVTNIEAEIAKCDLVCANCHRIRHALRSPRERPEVKPSLRAPVPVQPSKL